MDEFRINPLFMLAFSIREEYIRFSVMKDFKQAEFIIRIASLVFAVAGAFISIFVIGVNGPFIAGIILGTLAMNVNFHILGTVVDLYMNDGSLKKAGALYGLRILIYAVGLVICYFLTMKGIVGYGIGVLGICVGGAVYVLKGGEKQ